MLLASCKHPDPTLTKDGMLSMSAVRLRDAWLADAAETGLKWTVLSHELFNIPRVADLVQAGMNCTNHTTLAETELQLCRKILEKVVHKTKEGQESLQWADIEKEVLRSKPPGAMACPFMFAFVCKFGGGTLA